MNMEVCAAAARREPFLPPSLPPPSPPASSLLSDRVRPERKGLLEVRKKNLKRSLLFSLSDRSHACVR